jgi:glycosyltransferase involved in cell wall biosynthesis
VRRALVVSRVDRLKRVDLLLDALDLRPELADISFRILGVGPDIESLRQRAARTHPNVEFVGYSGDIAGELAKADLLVHTCPVETFGLAVLEAMAAKLAVLVPDAGGTAMLIEDGVSGFHFRADNAGHLGDRLVELRNAPPELFNRMVENALGKVHGEFSAETALRQYRELFSHT